MDQCYILCYKHTCNNMKLPLWFARKLWDEFILCYHVNYFDIGDFKGVNCFLLAQDLASTRNNPLIGDNFFIDISKKNNTNII